MKQGKGKVSSYRLIRFLASINRLLKKFRQGIRDFVNRERKKPYTSRQENIHEIIFEADTPMGKFFDISLLVLILLSIFIVMLESVPSIHDSHLTLFTVLEWIVTILFTVEYFLRIYCVKKPWKYIFSFYGMVDLLSILPTYLSALIKGSHYLVAVRAIRLLRVFRVLKLTQYLIEFQSLESALKASRRKISVFLGAVMIIVIIVGSIMYYIEGVVAGNTNFSSIPRSVYWGIVTVTTVGYGDIAPVTTVGQFIAAILMILGYGIIAVPTGIVSAEMVKSSGDVQLNTRSCKSCSLEGHANDAIHCKFCGEKL